MREQREAHPQGMDDRLDQLLARDASLLADLLRFAAERPELDEVVTARVGCFVQLFEVSVAYSSGDAQRPAFG